MNWVERLRSYQKEFERDQASRTSLEGVLLRLEQFAEENMARQYGPGRSAEPVEDLGLLGNPEDRWGITVIEGGAEMDEYPKAALLSLLSSILYFDAVARRRETLDGYRAFPNMQIFFEEANKVLTGVSGGAASDQNAGEGGNPVSHLFQTMWRDGRKYGIFLHLMAQTVSELPSGILSSCANLFVFQTKDPKDRDMILPHLGRSEKGLVNTEYKRYLARIPRTYAIAKLGYSEDVMTGTGAGSPDDVDVMNRPIKKSFRNWGEFPAPYCRRNPPFVETKFQKGKTCKPRNVPPSPPLCWPSSSVCW